MKQKICYVSAVVLILLLTCESYPQTTTHNFFKLKENSGILSDSQKTQLTEKEPVLAGTLSFIVPGFAVGQFYNGQTNKFFVHSLISFGLATAWGIHRRSFKYFGIVGAESIDLFGGLLIVVYATNWIWSIVDAVISSNAINKKARLKKYRTQKNHEINFRIGLDNNFRFKAAMYF